MCVCVCASVCASVCVSVFECMYKCMCVRDDYYYACVLCARVHLHVPMRARVKEQITPSQVVVHYQV